MDPVILPHPKQSADPQPLKQIGLSMMLLVLLVLVGAAGLVVLGDRSMFEALYLTVVILTTVGMESPDSDAERAWSLFLMIAGVGTVIYATGQVIVIGPRGWMDAITPDTLNAA